ncbi:MAG: hypothetical protein K1X29_05820 [Bdellovibrionales bacterium]|nr:hypothetical protein [Bdellovibrionales bacterium]
MKRKTLINLACLTLTGIVILNNGCSGDSTDFSVLPTSDTFYQNTSASNSKIDILWVVDNSGSMATSQQNLADNFPVFIDGFKNRNLDFQIAVTGTDAFIALPSMVSIYNSQNFYKSKSQDLWARFRDGNEIAHTGIFVINPLTLNLSSVFVTNAKLGTKGYYDERPFQSMKTALESPYNTGFVRNNSYLAVIIVTDEDDFSHDGTTFLDGNYTSTALHTTDSYISYLDTLTGSTADRKRYSVNAISIQDSTCLSQLKTSDQKKATRVKDLVLKAQGKNLSLCDDFATELELIADNILEQANQFYLNRIPNPSTISVIVNGQSIPKTAENPNHDGGWYYDSSSNSIVFQGVYIPSAGATIQVNFDPQSLGS